MINIKLFNNKLPPPSDNGQSIIEIKSGISWRYQFRKMNPSFERCFSRLCTWTTQESHTTSIISMLKCWQIWILQGYISFLYSVNSSNIFMKLLWNRSHAILWGFPFTISFLLKNWIVNCCILFLHHYNFKIHCDPVDIS